MAKCDREYRSGAVTMSYSTFGDPSAPPIVMVHGIGMGRIVFEGIAEILAAEYFVVTVDLPGFGDSPEPGTSASLLETAEVVGRFVSDTTAGPVVLVGHSMGTQIVAEVALQQPANVASLVLIAPTVNRYERRASTQAFRMLQDLAGESPKVLMLGTWEYLKTNPKWFVNKLRFMLAHRLEDRTPSIAVPTLVLRGETDRVCPRRWVSEIADSIPDSRMKEIPGRGHEAIIRSPEPVAGMIHEFLSTRKV